MKLLVTGASGLLGTRLCELAVRHKHEVYSAYSRHKPQYGTPIHLDITCNQVLEGIFETVKPDAVVHAAALSDVDRCEKEKELAWKTNAEATANVAKHCDENSAFLVYVSTDYVFDGNNGRYKETDRPNPISYYGFTKLMGEEHVKESKTEHSIARTSVIYGVIPAVGKMNFALWILDKLRRKESARVVTDQWNSPTLNTNLAEMIVEILEKRITGTIHLAGGTRISRYEFSLQIAEKFDLDSSYIKPVQSGEIPWIARRPKDSSLNTEKARKILDAKPLVILEALEKMKNEMESGITTFPT